MLTYLQWYSFSAGAHHLKIAEDITQGGVKKSKLDETV